MKVIYLNKIFPYMEAPTVVGGFTYVGTSKLHISIVGRRRFKKRKGMGMWFISEMVANI